MYSLLAKQLTTILENLMIIEMQLMKKTHVKAIIGNIVKFEGKSNEANITVER